MPRINRYIVGCKCTCITELKGEVFTELIDTQWDVNKVYWSLKEIKNEN